MPVMACGAAQMTFPADLNDPSPPFVFSSQNAVLCSLRNEPTLRSPPHAASPSGVLSFRLELEPPALVLVYYYHELWFRVSHSLSLNYTIVRPLHSPHHVLRGRRRH